MTSLSLLLLQNTLPDLPVVLIDPHRNRGGIWRISVPLSQQSGVFASQSYNLDSTSLQGRLSFERLGNSVRGVYEKIEYAGFETKKDSNRNDEAEIAQSEIHRSGTDEGAEPAGPRRCHFTDRAAWRVTPAADGSTLSSTPDKEIV